MQNRPLPLLYRDRYFPFPPTEPKKAQTTGRLAAQAQHRHSEGMQLFWAPRFCGGIQSEQQQRCFLYNYSRRTCPMATAVLPRSLHSPVTWNTVTHILQPWCLVFYTPRLR